MKLQNLDYQQLRTMEQIQNQNYLQPVTQWQAEFQNTEDLWIQNNQIKQNVYFDTQFSMAKEREITQKILRDSGYIFEKFNLVYPQAYQVIQRMRQSEEISIEQIFKQYQDQLINIMKQLDLSNLNHKILIILISHFSLRINREQSLQVDFQEEIEVKKSLIHFIKTGHFTQKTYFEFINLDMNILSEIINNYIPILSYQNLVDQKIDYYYTNFNAFIQKINGIVLQQFNDIRNQIKQRNEVILTEIQQLLICLESIDLQVAYSNCATAKAVVLSKINYNIDHIAILLEEFEVSINIFCSEVIEQINQSQRGKKNLLSNQGVSLVSALSELIIEKHIQETQDQVIRQKIIQNQKGNVSIPNYISKSIPREMQGKMNNLIQLDTSWIQILEWYLSQNAASNNYQEIDQNNQQEERFLFTLLQIQELSLEQIIKNLYYYEQNYPHFNIKHYEQQHDCQNYNLFDIYIFTTQQNELVIQWGSKQKCLNHIFNKDILNYINQSLLTIKNQIYHFKEQQKCYEQQLQIVYKTLFLILEPYYYDRDISELKLKIQTISQFKVFIVESLKQFNQIWKQKVTQIQSIQQEIKCGLLEDTLSEQPFVDLKNLDFDNLDNQKNILMIQKDSSNIILKWRLQLQQRYQFPYTKNDEISSMSESTIKFIQDSKTVKMIQVSIILNDMINQQKNLIQFETNCLQVNLSFSESIDALLLASQNIQSKYLLILSLFILENYKNEECSILTKPTNNSFKLDFESYNHQLRKFVSLIQEEIEQYNLEQEKLRIQYLKIQQEQQLLKEQQLLQEQQQLLKEQQLMQEQQQYLNSLKEQQLLQEQQQLLKEQQLMQEQQQYLNSLKEQQLLQEQQQYLNSLKEQQQAEQNQKEIQDSSNNQNDNNDNVEQTKEFQQDIQNQIEEKKENNDNHEIYSNNQSEQTFKKQEQIRKYSVVDQNMQQQQIDNNPDYQQNTQNNSQDNQKQQISNSIKNQDSSQINVSQLENTACTSEHQENLKQQQQQKSDIEKNNQIQNQEQQNLNQYQQQEGQQQLQEQLKQQQEQQKQQFLQQQRQKNENENQCNHHHHDQQKRQHVPHLVPAGDYVHGQGVCFNEQLCQNQSYQQQEIVHRQNNQTSQNNVRNTIRQQNQSQYQQNSQLLQQEENHRQYLQQNAQRQDDREGNKEDQKKVDQEKKQQSFLESDIKSQLSNQKVHLSDGKNTQQQNSYLGQDISNSEILNQGFIQSSQYEDKQNNQQSSIKSDKSEIFKSNISSKVKDSIQENISVSKELRQESDSNQEFQKPQNEMMESEINDEGEVQLTNDSKNNLSQQGFIKENTLSNKQNSKSDGDYEIIESIQPSIYRETEENSVVVVDQVQYESTRDLKFIENEIYKNKHFLNEILQLKDQEVKFIDQKDVTIDQLINNCERKTTFIFQNGKIKFLVISFLSQKIKKIVEVNIFYEGLQLPFSDEQINLLKNNNKDLSLQFKQSQYEKKHNNLFSEINSNISSAIQYILEKIYFEGKQNEKAVDLLTKYLYVQWYFKKNKQEFQSKQKIQIEQINKHELNPLSQKDIKLYQFKSCSTVLSENYLFNICEDTNYNQLIYILFQERDIPELLKNKDFQKIDFVNLFKGKDKNLNNVLKIKQDIFKFIISQLPLNDSKYNFNHSILLKMLDNPLVITDFIQLNKN